MKSDQGARICLVPRVRGVGGMVSFRGRLAAGLERRGVQVSDNLTDTPYEAVLVIGGTRRLLDLWQAKRRGVRIVQRLDGMNWLHRMKPGGRRASLRHFLKAEYGNFLLTLIRERLADFILYQSNFARLWWERVKSPARAPCSVVYNGVDLHAYSPHGPGQPPHDRCRILVVEGSLRGGYELGLEVAVRLAEGFANRMQSIPAGLSCKDVELKVVGNASHDLRKRWEKAADINVLWTGQVPGEKIPEIDRSAHLLYSADINTACPNSVVEALACGLPVLAFDTGALAEMVTGDAGRVVPYGGDPWRLDPPNIPALVEAAFEIYQEQGRFREAARQRAVEAFSLERMTEGYMEALFGT